LASADLGHLGVQFARAMGCETVAIARGAARADEARELGAHHYIDSNDTDVASALQALGGAVVVLATAGNTAAMGATVDGLGAQGELVVVGVTRPLPISPVDLITPGRSIIGTRRHVRDVEETMHFACCRSEPSSRSFRLHRRPRRTRPWIPVRPTTGWCSPPDGVVGPALPRRPGS
jgi:alcohol dehydrogenase